MPSNTCVTSESVSQSPPPRSVSFLTFWHDAECFAENPACWIERWELRQPGRWCEVRRQPSEGSGCRWQRPRSPSVFLAGSPVTLSSPSVSLVTPGAPQGGATFQVSVCFSWTCNGGCDLPHVPKLLPEAGPCLLLICDSAEGQREVRVAGCERPLLLGGTRLERHTPRSLSREGGPVLRGGSGRLHTITPTRGRRSRDPPRIFA